MNREIKFRAWDNSWKVKVMLYFGLFDTDGGFCSKDATDIRDAIIMQYTGLKDKNGVEIYEGDILDCIYKFDGCKEHKLQVVWTEELAKFRLKDIGECHQSKVIKTMGDMTRTEVIGNIYQNKELLTKK